MTAYNIDIVSDTVCPWCYVGKNRLDAAIAQHKASNPADSFTTKWHPFYLNPQAPKSVDKQAYYEQKFGAERTKVMQAHLARLGKQAGINFAFGGKTGNTRDSHRLIQLGLSKGEEVQTKVVEQLFNAYFEEEEDITTPAVLIKRGVAAGLDEAEVKDWMESDKGGAEVDREWEQAQKKFISKPLGSTKRKSKTGWKVIRAEQRWTGSGSRRKRSSSVAYPTSQSTGNTRSRAQTNPRRSCRSSAKSRMLWMVWCPRGATGQFAERVSTQD
nr:uncharacterized protein ywbo [Quercus suber]